MLNTMSFTKIWSLQYFNDGYYSKIHSQFNYCLSSSSSAPKTTINPLDILQKRAVKIITFSNSKTHINPSFHKLQILKLHDLYTLETAKLRHKLNIPYILAYKTTVR